MQVRFVAIVLAVAGFVAALVLKDRLPGLSDSLVVTNFRGRRVPAVGGLVLVLSTLFCAGILSAAGPPLFPWALWGPPSGGLPASLGYLLIVVGFFALGLIDDVSNMAGVKGLKGHLGALRQGQITGGLIKAAGGLALAYVVSAAREPRLGPAIFDALTIAACANVYNLLDLRPGRACKFYFVAWIPLALLANSRTPFFLPLSAGLTGAAAGWLPGDLSEDGMLGDSGSNMLGAAIGAGIVYLAPFTAQLVILAALIASSLASERFSFSKIIDGFGPLRWFDGLGRARQ